MLNRRQAVFGACCALHAAASGRVSAQDEEAPEPNEFLCATKESALSESGDFQIERYAAEDAPSQIEIDKAQGEFGITLFGTSFLKERWRRSDGDTPRTGRITLGVAFIGGDAATHEAIAATASQWLKARPQTLAFDFDAPLEKAQIRIAFTRGEGDYSAVGRTALKIPSGLKTMNLETLTAPTILHEFGHALGLRHEHNHPGGRIAWNEARVLRDMKALGWDERTTRSNILDRYGAEAACVGDRRFNRRSIMLYPIPRRWTRNRFSSEKTTEISERDLRCVAGIYGV